MGKKQGKTKGKFDNVEISRPLLSAEMIKAIHTPPNQKQKEGGFKALFANSDSQDLLDDIPAASQHLPSYVGISCAISGYTNYSPYLKSTRSGHNSPCNTNSNHTANNGNGPTKSITNSPSMTSSPLIGTNNPSQTADELRSNQISNKLKSSSYNTNETNGRLTPNTMNSDGRRVPSPSISRVEDDRHHGTCVGARYCLLPAPDKSYNKHIPLLGIDDDKIADDSDELETDANKSVQKRIASLYGNQFAEGWKETNSHKTRRDVEENSMTKETITKNPKDLVKLKPTPSETKVDPVDLNQITLPDNTTLSKAPVFAGVEKQFLGQLLSNGVSIKPKSQVPRIINSNKANHAASQLINSFKEEHNLKEEQIDTDSSNTKNDYDHPAETIPISPTADDKLILDTNIDPVMDISSNFVDPKPVKLEVNEEKNDSTSDDKYLLDMNQEKLVEFTDLALTENTQKDTSQNYNDLLNVSDNNIGQDLIENEGPTELISVQNHSLKEEPSNDILVDLDKDSEKLTEDNNIVFEERNHQDSQDTQDDKEEDSEEIQEIKNESVVEEKLTQLSSSSRDGRYFLKQLELRSNSILKDVKRADVILKEEGEGLDEESLGKLHSAIGKANLLLNKKCKQFEGLCANNLATEDKEEKYATLNDDLEGFWDMIVIQLNECEEAFKQLWIAQTNGWKSDENQLKESGPSNRSQPSKLPRPKLNAQKDQERRDRLQEHIDNIKKQQEAAKQQKKNSRSQSPELISGTTQVDEDEEKI